MEGGELWGFCAGGGEEVFGEVWEGGVVEVFGGGGGVKSIV